MKNRIALQKFYRPCKSAHAISMPATQQLERPVLSGCHPSHPPLTGEIISTHTALSLYQHPRVNSK